MLLISFQTLIGILSVAQQLVTPATGFVVSSPSRSRSSRHATSWTDLDSMIASLDPPPTSIDSVLQPAKPSFSTDHPTLFRERHGWCPYSERVWLALELCSDSDYTTVRIDNTGGGRPSYYGGLTPQMRWPDGRTQGESMDLVQEIDERYGAGKLQSDSSQVQDAIQQFRNIFPRRARPSSRAAFLFQGNGDPLWKSTFEETLQGTNDFLSQTKGPFFCGNDLTAAEIAWAPFLERYRYQLPCLHEGLEPYDEKKYPHLFQWYQAMDKVPEYACRVKGDASSWRKVLSMAGFGNAGLPAQIGSNMDELTRREAANAASTIDQEVWDQYAASRPYVASTPQAEAGAIIIKNRAAILKDTVKRAGSQGDELPTTEEGVDEAMRGLSKMLMDGEVEPVPSVQALAKFLDERMCIPRDMGAMSAASIKQIANA